MIDRPDIGYDDAAHAYTIDGEPVPGVSTVAKIASNPAPLIKWAYRIGRDGASDTLREMAKDGRLRVSKWPGWSLLDAEMERAGRTPWATRQEAADRGNAIHDALERLAQDGTPPDLSDYSGEARGHARGLIRWFLDVRPEFEATEVAVGSREHGFAGRYDIRARVHPSKLDGFPGGPPEAAVRLLVDLKTSKRVYPTEHFPQLDGYELASCEMGYAPTDAQYVLRTSKDGTYEFVRSWAPPGCFLGFLAAYRAKAGVEWADPEAVAKREAKAAREALLAEVLDQLPGKVADIAAGVGRPPREVSALMQALKRAGRVKREPRQWVRVSDDGQ